MSKTSDKKTLADSISNLLSAAPSYHPDEQSDNDETAAKVVDFDSEEQEPLELFQSANSDVRRPHMSFIDELYERYLGKVASRKHLKDEIDETKVDLEHIDQEAPSSDDDVNDESHDVPIDAVEEKKGKEPMSFSFLNLNTPESLMKRGQCVQQQIGMWENLLEVRIQMQKCLVASNKLPQTSNFKAMHVDKDFAAKCDGVTSSLRHLLNKMLELQMVLVNQYPESKNLLQKNGSRVEDIEEVPSDSDDESSRPDAPSAKKPRRRTANELAAEIESRHRSYTPFRNEMIQLWNDKTQLLQPKKTKTQSMAVLKQIEHILLDRRRLVKRTQLMRSEYRILADASGDGSEYNSNIFDDDDFYHQLLRELIEVKSVDVTDPIQLSRQWIQLQNMRSKMKRKIDTRATKGRRIRYGVHTKLVNFMAPICDREARQRDDADLFQSVFGAR